MFRSAPAPRPGEMFYSVMARYCKYLQVPEAGPFIRLALGDRLAIASCDLPGNLAAFVGDLSEERRVPAIDGIIDSLTAFPFHTAFMPAEVRAEVRQAMRGDVTGVYTRLGLAAFKVRPPERLRFCPECLDVMEAERGDLWWRRDHQLPGVPVCPVHGSALRLSSVDPRDRNRHSFVAATRAVCRADADRELGDVGHADMERLVVLARAASVLLNAPPLARNFADTAARYRVRLSEVGLMRSPRKVDHARMLAAFHDRWGGVPDLIPGLALGDDPERCWLAVMVRTGRRAAHPLQHLMLSAMLDGLAAVPADQPFGAGPWPCRNPIAGHYGKLAIGNVVVRRDRGALYGDFACSCGYLYTRAISAGGVVGEPRFRRFGPLLVPALTAAVKRGDGLRATARSMGLDPKTLMREAAMASVVVPWTTSPSGTLPAHTERKVVAAKRGPSGQRRPRAKRNWFAIDVRLARSARQAATTIGAERPPVRVTFAEIERRIARRDWIVKRRAKLPGTVAVMMAAIEDTSMFRRRRLVWHVDRAIIAGDVRPCEILRVAGLPMSELPAVRDAVAVVQLRGRAAA